MVYGTRNSMQDDWWWWWWWWWWQRVNIKLYLHQRIISPVMSYVFPACEFTANTYLLKLQRLQKRNVFLHSIGNFIKRTPVRELYMAFEIPHVHDWIIELRRRPGEVHKITNIRSKYWTRRRQHGRCYKRFRHADGPTSCQCSNSTIRCAWPGLKETDAPWKLVHNLQIVPNT